MAVQFWNNKVLFDDATGKVLFDCNPCCIGGGTGCCFTIEVAGFSDTCECPRCDLYNGTYTGTISPGNVDADGAIWEIPMSEYPAPVADANKKLMRGDTAAGGGGSNSICGEIGPEVTLVTAISGGDWYLFGDFSCGGGGGTEGYRYYTNLGSTGSYTTSPVHLDGDVLNCEEFPTGAIELQVFSPIFDPTGAGCICHYNCSGSEHEENGSVCEGEIPGAGTSTVSLTLTHYTGEQLCNEGTVNDLCSTFPCYEETPPEISLTLSAMVSGCSGSNGVFVLDNTRCVGGQCNSPESDDCFGFNSLDSELFTYSSCWGLSLNRASGECMDCYGAWQNLSVWFYSNREGLHDGSLFGTDKLYLMAALYDPSCEEDVINGFIECSEPCCHSGYDESSQDDECYFHEGVIVFFSKDVTSDIKCTAQWEDFIDVANNIQQDGNVSTHLLDCWSVMNGAILSPIAENQWDSIAGECISASGAIDKWTAGTITVNVISSPNI